MLPPYVSPQQATMALICLSSQQMSQDPNEPNILVNYERVEEIISNGLGLSTAFSRENLRTNLVDFIYVFCALLTLGQLISSLSKWQLDSLGLMCS